MLIMDYQYVKA